MKNCLIILFILFFTSTFAISSCEKCNIEKISIVDKNIDSLNYQMVYEFLCTFDSTCNINAEYTEWSNEVLFKVLEKAPKLFFQVILKEKLQNEVILNEIKGPILDPNIKKIYDKIKEITILDNIKKNI